MPEKERNTSLMGDDANTSASSPSNGDDNEDDDDIEEDKDEEDEAEEDEVRVTVEAGPDANGSMVVSFLVVPRSLFCASGLTSVDVVSVTHLPSTSRDDDELEYEE